MKLFRYQEFILEDVSKWKRSWVKDDSTRELGSEYQPHEMLEYITSFHDQDNYDDTDFDERIHQYEKFVLRMVDLDELDLDEFTLDDWKVDEYIEDYKNEKGEYPAIVVGEGLRFGKLGIIDGLHRANAFDKMGKSQIKAYVGVGTPDLNESMVNELVNTSKVYPYRKEEISGDYVRYYFKNDSGTPYTVLFDFKRYSISEDVWVRSFRTKRGYDLTGEGDVYNILNTISKITVDFLLEYDIDRLEIKHIPEEDENIEDRLKENKRARVNKIFLQRHLPTNYNYELKGYKSIITKNI